MEDKKREKREKREEIIVLDQGINMNVIEPSSDCCPTYFYPFR